MASFDNAPPLSLHLSIRRFVNVELDKIVKISKPILAYVTKQKPKTQKSIALCNTTIPAGPGYNRSSPLYHRGR